VNVLVGGRGVRRSRRGSRRAALADSGGMRRHHDVSARPEIHKRPGDLLIGDESSLRGLAAMVGSLGSDGPRVAGALLVGPVRRAGDEGDRSRIGGLPILGPVSILEQVHAAVSFDRAILSLPASSAAESAAIQARLADIGLAFRVTPPVSEILGAGPALAGEAQPLDLAALLDREPRPIDRGEIAAALARRRVLITGAGGSIGSELARLVASFGPSEIGLMERSENALFEIDRVLRSSHPNLSRRAMLHDVVDARGTRRLMEDFRPHAVFHAAAHKHVPLMEDHPRHAVTNNFFGAKSIADAAVATGAERLVLISTDKAVNPTSVMGATKRLAERYVQGLAPHAASTRLGIVRFGNVLGSAGSVIPIWRAQLAEDGPITITDRRMTRFFMTIPEAAALVLQASALPQRARTAALYELDMGDPVPIVEMARRFCLAYGREPLIAGEPARTDTTRRPIDIVFTGARPGEKIHEELAYQAEQVRETGRPGIRSWVGPEAGGAVDIGRMANDLAIACDAVRAEPEAEAVINAIRRWVPEMTRSGLAGAESGSHQLMEPRAANRQGTTAA